ncbi:hypothetical protein D3C72_1558130 [compost metagenome]
MTSATVQVAAGERSLVGIAGGAGGGGGPHCALKDVKTKSGQPGPAIGQGAPNVSIRIGVELPKGAEIGRAPRIAPVLDR